MFNLIRNTIAVLLIVFTPVLLAQDLATMLEKTMPAVVNIQAEGESQLAIDPFSDNRFRNPREHGGRDRFFTSFGSGVIVDAKKGYIITNAHVIFEATNITITLNDGKRYKATPIGFDVGFDLALLQIKAPDLVAIDFADSSKLKVGDSVIAIGSPFNLRQTVTEGIVSALHRNINLDGVNEDFIQTDAAINLGSSGGALVNREGKLVGINTAILAPEGGNIGIGFAIPINLANSVMEHLIKYGKIDRGLLGVHVQDLTPSLADSFGANVKEGALVSQVLPKTPAEKAGIKSGDIIIAIDNMPISNSSILRNQVNLSRPESTIQLKVIRNGKSSTVRATLTSGESFAISQFDANTEVLAGVNFEDFNQLNSRFGHIKGVQVIHVERSSDAWSGLLRPGDVIISANQQDITNLDDLNKILANLKENKILLQVLREAGAIYLTVP